MFFTLHRLLNFVFDRGKSFMDANFNLEDKVVFKEVRIDRNVIEDVSLEDFGPKPRVWKSTLERKQKE
jgi:hypothetical protein